MYYHALVTFPQKNQVNYCLVYSVWARQTTATLHYQGEDNQLSGNNTILTCCVGIDYRLMVPLSIITHQRQRPGFRATDTHYSGIEDVKPKGKDSPVDSSNCRTSYRYSGLHLAIEERTFPFRAQTIILPGWVLIAFGTDGVSYGPTDAETPFTTGLPRKRGCCPGIVPFCSFTHPNDTSAWGTTFRTLQAIDPSPRADWNHFSEAMPQPTRTMEPLS